MRKTSVRRFIHAVLDVLPLLIIPIFALNILHKETEPISIEVQEKISVDYNQLGKAWENSNYGLSVTYTDNTCMFNVSGTATSNNGPYIFERYQQGFVCKPNHKYYVRSTIGYSEGLRIQNTTSGQYQSGLYVNTIFTSIFDVNSSCNVWFFGTNGTSYNIDFYCNIYDLTQMGIDDITKEDFDVMFPSYTSQIESEKLLLDKPSPTTYNSTDIGSQFVYALYKPVHDYFNFNNLFNMGAIYNWIELNLFSGTAPLPIFIIWNVIVYEFFIDLIFLMYSLFMFIIDWSTNMIDKFLYKSRS